MRLRLATAATILALLASGVYFAADPAPPKDLVYESKQGTVTFSHEKHGEATKGDCKACHDGIWKQERGTLGYKDGMHKKAEAAKASCATCHVAGGTSFESKGNCAKCHVKPKPAAG